MVYIKLKKPIEQPNVVANKTTGGGDVYTDRENTFTKANTFTDRVNLSHIENNAGLNIYSRSGVINLLSGKGVSINSERLRYVGAPIEDTDGANKKYVDDAVAAAGGGGTTDHNVLTNRDLANQHTTASITGLDGVIKTIKDDMTSVNNKTLVNAEGVKKNSEDISHNTADIALLNETIATKANTSDVEALKASVITNTQKVLRNERDITALETNTQKKLVAGTNITIDQATNTISATGGSIDAYTKAETNNLLALKADKTALDTLKGEVDYNTTALNGKVDLTTYYGLETKVDTNTTNVAKKADKTYVDTQLTSKATQTDLDAANVKITALETDKQGTLTAGTGIDITNNVISSTGGSSVITFTIDVPQDMNQVINGKKVKGVYIKRTINSSTSGHDTALPAAVTGTLILSNNICRKDDNDIWTNPTTYFIDNGLKIFPMSWQSNRVMVKAFDKPGFPSGTAEIEGLLIYISLEDA